MNTMNIIGKKINRLTIISFNGSDKHRRLLVNTVCECGGQKVVPLSKIKNGITKSCGCLEKENLENLHRNNIIHNESNSPLNNIYRNLKNRCYNKNSLDYKNYGGRGIKVSEIWLSYKNFSKDMKKSYENHKKNNQNKRTTIERLDVNGDYCKENCIWVTDYIQANNKRNTVKVAFKGEQVPLSYVAKEIGINYRTLYNRIFVYKWSISKALSTDVS